jgi:hypothetical protein
LTMSIARHHNEWLSLLEASGPFLSLPVLLEVFPQGLDAHNPDLSAHLRPAYGEWEDGREDQAIHTAWVEFVLASVLEYPTDHLLSGQSIPVACEARLSEHNERLRPSHALKSPREDAARLLISVYPPGQSLGAPVAASAWKASPDTRMMTLLHATGVPLGLVANGEQWMLVGACRGQTTTYVSWYASLWSEEPLTLRAFRTLIGVRRFFGVPDSERLPALLERSLQNQQEVTVRLGVQVRRAVEVLVQALDRIDLDRDRKLLDGVADKTLYEAALTVMMRLVFLFAAEERGLLLLGEPLYDLHYAVSTLRDQLREVADNHGEEILERRHDAWSRLLATTRVVHGGAAHETLRLPAYGGALFDPDRYPFLEGRPIGSRWRDTPAAPLPVSNRTVLHLLEALQFLEMRVPGGGTENRRLSFRALDIEQIGHVYEGLLDHTAARAKGAMLGLTGAKDREPEVALAALERAAEAGDTALIELLREETGRSAATLRRALGHPQPDDPMLLQVACGSDPDLYRRVAPFARLLREDAHGYPLVILPGSVYVTAGEERRSTGTQYTSQTLTEPIVKTTLDPLLYRGFADGEEPAPERLRSPEEILRLRVCDPACGSGAFLVQACRYLAECLVEAWAFAERTNPARPLVVPEAARGNGGARETLLPLEVEERLALARRLVAERCLYGVDVNPMAVEMAKLSLWLVTLHRHRPFTFLDHAIKCGDSLVGITSEAQIRAFHLLPDRGAAQEDWITKIGEVCHDALAHARAARERLERFTALDIRDSEAKGRLHREAEEAAGIVRALGDLIVGAGLATAGSNARASLNALDEKLQDLAHAVAAEFEAPPVGLAAEADVHELQRHAVALLKGAGRGRNQPRPFHWLVEFPEVFLDADNPGFDAIVGNPPFIGGQKITGLFGTDYRDYLVLHTAGGRRGSADLCAYFFLRAGQLLKRSGNFGLLAVNTIAEGDTRQVGLEAMLKGELSIYAAHPNEPWPGDAAVVVSRVHVHKGRWKGPRVLSERPAATISAFLSDEEEWSPKPLRANAGKSFIGSYVLGMGFTMTEEEARAFMDRDPKNGEVLFPYLNGEDLNSHPEQKPSRWVINFWDWPLDRTARGSWENGDERQQLKWLRDGRVPKDYPGRVAADFPELLRIVEEKVKPERDRLKGNQSAEGRKKRWWLYGRDAKALYHAIGRGQAFARHPEEWDGLQPSLPRILTCSLVSKFLGLAFRPTDEVYAHRLVVFALSDFGSFGFLSSTVNEAWARKNSSSLETRLNYSPSDAFETLPWPERITGREFAAASEAYYMNRAHYMRDNRLGLTDTYNRFHNPQCRDGRIESLRRLHCEVDDFVLTAYGWTDIKMNHDFHAVSYLPANDRIRFTISEEARLEVLRRLSRLNRERWEQEQAELGREDGRPSRTPKGKSKPKLEVLQGGLFDG